MNYQEGWGNTVTPPILGATPPPPPVPVPPVPVPPAVDPIVLKAMADNGEDAPIGPTNDPNLHYTAGSKGLYISRDDLRVVAFIAWTAAEPIP